MREMKLFPKALWELIRKKVPPSNIHYCSYCIINYVIYSIYKNNYHQCLKMYNSSFEENNEYFNWNCAKFLIYKIMDKPIRETLRKGSAYFCRGKDTFTIGPKKCYH